MCIYVCVIDCKCISISATWKIDESRNLLLKMCKKYFSAMWDSCSPIVLVLSTNFGVFFCFRLFLLFFCYPFIEWLESRSGCKFMHMLWGWTKNSRLRLRLRLSLLNSKDNVYKPNLSIKMFDNHRTYLLLFCLKA